ncbi:MAG TPA: UDP-N-acetylglucosamine 1-carboxyvinyltransferase [Bacteroidales bacterium]|nr:UDP-N-acetylglucosamine 1-carboxyvinyltransferase [Bacteroidales bacterium]
MNTFEIQGGKKLKGTIEPQGAKNEALQVICATLLTSEQVVIDNIPEIIDVIKLIDILKLLGVKIERLKKGTYSFQADAINIEKFNSQEFIDKMTGLRGSIMILGPLITRFGIAMAPKPGGDKIGRRRIDTHLIGLQKLGATIEINRKNNTYILNSKKLKGTYILLDEASVTGTANIIMAATLAEGTTTIFNAACEPYILQLCKMLNKMGADISGIGSNLLTIKGTNKLYGTKHSILPDIIEIGSFIGLAAMTQSEITISNVDVNHLGLIPHVFQKLGVEIQTKNNNLYIPPQENYNIETFIDGSILTISDAPWPGFTPDLISIALVTAIQANGSVLIHQKMFESRLFFVDKLIEMGAQIILCDPHRATVIGLNRKYPLRSINMSSPDIRAGVALLIAALSAEGTSIISNIEQIDRGYENIDQRLNQLGAEIKRI